MMTEAAGTNPEHAAAEAMWRRRASEIGRDPVADGAGNGSGIDVAEAIAEIQAEFQLERSAVGGVTDWSRVAERSEEVLRRGGKDIRAAVFLAVAWGRLEGSTGWATGLAVIAEMVGGHWPDVLPEPATRVRAHVAAMEVLLDRLGEHVEHADPPTTEAAMRLLEAAELVRAAVEGTANSATPLPADLRTRVDGRLGRFGHGWREAAEAPRKTSAEGADATGDLGPPAAETPRPPASTAARKAPLDAASASKELPAVRARVMEIAALLQAEDPFQPEPYTLLRAVAWANVEALEVVAGDGGRRHLAGMPGPASRDLPSATGPIADRDLVACEAIVRKKPYWLDASVRMAALLEARGAEAARTAVVAQVTSLLARRPELGEVCFEDGTPVLTETPPREVERGRAPRHLPAAAAPDARLGVGDGDDVEHEDELPRATGGRADLIRMLAAVRAEGRRVPPASRNAIVRHLLERCRSISLEAWEPALAVDVYRTILAVSDGDDVEHRAHALEGLARVRPDLLIDGEEA